MSTTGGSNPEYVIARTRAQRSALFGDEEYHKLARMGPAEIARFMEESEYETEVNALSSRFSGVDLIEYALNQNLAKQFNDILDWADSHLCDLIARYLCKFDAWNVKTVIRGLYPGTSREEVESDLIRAGEFDNRLTSRLLDTGETEEVVSVLLGTIFGDGLAAAYEEYEEVGVLVPLENAVDHAFYEQLLDDLVTGEEAKRYRELLKAEIDFRNACNALRIARSGADLDPVDYFIEGGTLFRTTELASLATSPNELVSKIRDSRYGDRLSAAPSDLEAANSLIGFEHTLDAALLEYADTLGYVFSLSVTPIVPYTLAREREVDGVRAITRGREAGLDPDAIEAELVIL